MLNSFLISFTFFISFSLFANKKPIQFGIMVDDQQEISEYEVLKSYIEKKGVQVQIRGFGKYDQAQHMFKMGKLDIMLAGNGVAAFLISHKKAEPFLKPIRLRGKSTNYAVVIGPKSAPPFNGKGDFFHKKQISVCSLSASGEYYVRSLGVKESNLIKTGTHVSALRVLSQGISQYAVIKNHVWRNYQGEFPGLKLLGRDEGECPYSTLIKSSAFQSHDVMRVKAILLNLKNDKSKTARLVKTTLGILEFVEQKKSDYNHTFMMLEKAGVKGVKADPNAMDHGHHGGHSMGH